MVTKICRKCNLEFDLSNFTKSDRLKDGHLNSCKKCQSEKQRAHYLKNKQLYIDRSKKWKLNNKEKVSECDKKYRAKNSEKEKLRGRIWQQENKEKTTEKTRRWQRSNKEKFKNYRVNYIKNKLENDPIFKLKKKISGNIRDAIKRGGYKKTGTTKDILGCEYELFLGYIESQFLEGMNWGNIHLDHIKPISIAKTEFEIYELNHYTNFQPLFKRDNIIKSNKLIQKQLRLL